MSLDEWLQNVLKDIISIQNRDKSKYNGIFRRVLESIVEKMKSEDTYFKKYANKIQYAGSNYDGIKIGKPDEFDMDIVVKLPINYDEISLENMTPGLVKVKIGKAFDDLPKQQDWEKCHVVTLSWRDENKYFLRSKFQDWIQSLIHKGINKLDRSINGNPCILYDGIEYEITHRKAGPAFTINTRCADKDFVLDVDFVPVIQFNLDKLPKGYDRVKRNNRGKEDWFIVPKAAKNAANEQQQAQSWRMAFHDQEREILKANNYLKPTIKLIKKLRDVQKMDGIASYYIKTLFLWEVEKQKPDFWQKKISVIFPFMVKKLLDAVSSHKIPYFWNEKLNLLQFLNTDLRNAYEKKLTNVCRKIELDDMKGIMRSILTESEFKALNIDKTDNHSVITSVPVPSVSPTINFNDTQDFKVLILHCLEATKRIEAIVKSFDKKQNEFETKLVGSLNSHISKLNARLDKLENKFCNCRVNENKI